MAKTKQTAQDIIRQGREVEVTYRDGTKAKVFVREASIRELVDGSYMDLLVDDYPALLARMCNEPPAWIEELTRESFARLREVESALNFDSALAETQAAVERGQKLQFVREEAARQAAAVLELIRSTESQTSLPDMSKPLEYDEIVRLSSQSAGSSAASTSTAATTSEKG